MNTYVKDLQISISDGIFLLIQKQQQQQQQTAHMQVYNYM